MKSLRLLLQLLAPLLLCYSLPSYAEDPKVYQLDKYQLKMFSDGSGSFGLPGDFEVFGNSWSVMVRKDEMTDKRVVTAYRMALLPESTHEAGLGLYLNFSKPSVEYVCVFGHDFPGRTAMIRVGNNAPVTTNNQGCVLLSKALDKQLRNSKQVKVRGREWPNDWDLTFDVNLDGYVDLTEHLRTVKLR